MATNGLQIGYLSVVDDPESGFFGGYLVVDGLGRPLEFQCTAPVRPSRALQILYGPTLRPYLIGELIGSTLLGKAQLAASLIVTNQSEVVCLVEHVDCPIAYLAEGQSESKGMTATVTGTESRSIGSGDSTPDGDASQGEIGKIGGSADGAVAQVYVRAGGYVFEVAGSGIAGQANVEESLERLAETIDLTEPFDRIGEAICEAQRISHSGPPQQSQLG